MHRIRHRWLTARLFWAAALWCLAAHVGSAQPPPPDAALGANQFDLPPPSTVRSSALPSELGDRQATPIDLATALDLAGVRNPEILLARERVTEMAAIRQFAAVQILPNLNAGTSFDTHSGPVQQSSGHILKVSRSDLFVGAGVNAIAAGTVNIPGVMWNQNIGQGIFTYLVARQTTRQRQFASEAVRNQVLKRVALAYIELLRNSGRRAVLMRLRDDAAEIARLTAAYADTGRGRPADADRAATELARRQAELITTEGGVLMASSRLAQLLNLEPTVELRPADEWVVPTPLVPEPITISELIGMAYLRRPELAASRAGIQTAILGLRGSQTLPFSPTVLVGLSSGTFGGGSNLQPVRFGEFRHRLDFDVLAYWTLQNMGVGNYAQIDLARSRLRQGDWNRLLTLNIVRAEVAQAAARSQVSFAQIGTAEQAVRGSLDAFTEDLVRIRNNEGLPIEVLESLRLLGRSRFEYLEAISEYNQAQFELYVALGQPPANALARPARPAPQAMKPKPRPPTPQQLAASIKDKDRASRSYLPLARWNESRPAPGPPEEDASTSVAEISQPAGEQPQPPEQRPSPEARRLSHDAPLGDGETLPPPPADLDEGGFDEGEPGARIYAETVGAPPALTKPDRDYVIDLPTTVRLVLRSNPTVGEARELVRETLALQTQARTMLLPSLNAGLMLHLHQGNLQASTGQIKNIYNDSFYYGGGARVVAAEAPAIPMVRLFSHLGDAIFEPLAARQQVISRRLDASATANTIVLEGVVRYFELLREEGRLEAALQTERETAEIARVTATFAQIGQGRESDADRARAEAYLMHTEVQRAQSRVSLASTRLAELLSLDPSVRLRTASGPIVGLNLVDVNLGLETLIRMAERRRPEIASAGALVEHNATRVRQEKARPLFPVVMVGYSSASYGGGGVINPPLMANFRGRQDFDVMALWSMQNMGVGNSASISERRATFNQAVADRTRTINDIRQQVIAAYGLVKGEEIQIQITQRQLSDSERGFREEYDRLMGADALPIEVLNSVNQLGSARQDLVKAVTSYNSAQFRLFVAVGASAGRTLNAVKDRAAP